MSDPRFSRLKTDPRFRRPRKHHTKVVVDDRFKDIFQSENKSAKDDKAAANVDKFGRRLSKNHEKDSLRQFYRLQNEENKEEPSDSRPDYARGEILLESSDEDELDHSVGNESDVDLVVLGRKDSKRASTPAGVPEIDLDEGTFAELDAQAAAYNASLPNETQLDETAKTRRLAVVNLDWDNVRALHLYKIFSSVLSTSVSSSSGRARKPISGKVLNVRIYPSDFGKERLAREEKEGPPPEIFKRKEPEPEEVDGINIYDVGDEADYDEDALRKYQLERLRYYYAIVTCDKAEAAALIYSELEGTELERSANVFDLSFVPEEMDFDTEFRDEATEDSAGGSYQGIDFVTDALRHSKVKLTWDEDEPERMQTTRRNLSRKEIEEADFKAYLASSSESEAEADGPDSIALGNNKNERKTKAASRERLRALLIADGEDTLPEGWGEQGDKGDIDMEITFTPGLSESKGVEDENVLESYQRRMKEKRKKRKEERTKKPSETGEMQDNPGDDFPDGGSQEEEIRSHSRSTTEKRKRKGEPQHMNHDAEVIAAEELALLVVPDNPNGKPTHFSMKAVIRAEKGSKGKRKKTKHPHVDEDQELQEEFSIDVKDARFKALHEDHTFAIDPSHPQFKKTKSMAALLEERSKRRKKDTGEAHQIPYLTGADSGDKNLESLVQSVKRKSSIAGVKSGGRQKS